jgi:hypothetical protein
LIRYEPSVAELTEVLNEVRAAGVTIVIPEAEERQAHAPPDAAALGYAMETTAGRLNRWVAERTSGGADLRSIVPIGFALLAVREVIAGRVVAAPWYALAWYAFDSYLKLRRPDQTNSRTDGG